MLTTQALAPVPPPVLDPIEPDQILRIDRQAPASPASNSQLRCQWVWNVDQGCLNLNWTVPERNGWILEATA